ncbi:hypothetical protein L6164_016562 [Bauhinia variegata]|uniref:Uncharacterized protein n=1 Tax=Bauhinia variegata TaxID=167791 RepID=A0ACB9NNS7_BAUVA|nr:hypothetical protein L6164_016562 [Bauhinia variegata]
MAEIDVSEFAHSPVHKAIILKDYDSLKSILEALPKLSNPHEIQTEAASIAEEEKADQISAVVDRRDVPNHDTPLHIAAKLGDKTATEMLMLAGASKTLNKQGLSALKIAIANRHRKIAMIIVRHSWPQLNMKWHRRLPRYIATLRRMTDFYMEISFHFESSVIPFISRIAPSDTYKIWKRGGNMRADMTLAGFDGLKIKRADKSLLFLGDSLEDEKKSNSSLYIVSHKKKEVIIGTFTTNPPTDEECRRRLAKKCRESSLRIGFDVSQAVLEPQMTWRRKERKEMVGPWKAKVYDMQNIYFWTKSSPDLHRAKTEDKVLNKENEKGSEEVENMLTEEEKKKLEAARSMDSLEKSNSKTREKKEKKGQSGRGKEKEQKKGKRTRTASVNSSSSGVQSQSNGNGETEHKRGMRPVLWISENYPLKIEELLPLLDLLAEKVKAVRRLRELLTTTLPKGTFPVKVAIPCVSSVRVIITFSKFEELPPVDEFSSAPSSPTAADSNEPAETSSSSGSWFQWKSSNGPSSSGGNEDLQDLFSLPSDYKQISDDDKNKQKQPKAKTKTGKS